MAEPTHIVVRQARTHNLRGVDVAVPRHQLVVFTGVSGSGKSSLVFDTIFQEGQRRFVESLSAYARQFLGDLDRPDVDAVEGVSPALSIDQKTVNRNPRSTVGTVTEILDHLRLLWARLGQPHCPLCATPIDRLGVDQVVDRVLALGDGRKVQVLGPVVQERKGTYRKELLALGQDGWLRARVDGAEIRLDEEPPTLDRYVKHTIEVVVDRLRLAPSLRTRLAEAIETGLRLGGGVVRVLVDDDAHTFSTARACPNHADQSVPELEPRLFSFNAPQGACPTCEGLGELVQFEPARLVDERLPVPDCFLAFNADGKLPFGKLTRASLVDIARALGADVDAPVRAWTEDQRRRLMHGDPRVTWSFDTSSGKRRTVVWDGLLPRVERVWHYTKFPPLERFRSRRPCPDCGGDRLNPIARHVLFRGRTLPSLAGATLADARAFFDAVDLAADERDVGALVLQEIRDRLAFLDDVGLGYLSIGRRAATLSGGESQRIRLASQVGSGLQGVTYVLDEPSIGLHPRDNARLLDALRQLRDRGNSVLVVEHDEETIRAADWVVDVGPGAGREGGHVLVSGPPSVIAADPRSPTGAWLRGELGIDVPAHRRPGSGAWLTVHRARRHNLRDVTLRVPLGTFTAVTGVSGSGKSTLVFGVLEEGLAAMLDGGLPPEDCDGIDGIDGLSKLVRVDQKPIGRTPRSNPATYAGALTPIRDLFAATEESRLRGYTKSRFSFNVKGGRCEDCEGAGVKVVEMQFLPDVEVPCETCGGRRFNRETLEITYKGRSIADVLDMTIAEAHAFFAAVPALDRILGTLVEVGLGYVALGQPATTLSGGEAQRVKLARELQRPPTGDTLYLLDEPTTGLHTLDIRALMGALQALVDHGNTVLVVEHHTDVIKCADHVIDLGPEGGAGGGEILFAGTPEQLAAQDSPSGRALAVVPGLAGALRPSFAAEAPVAMAPARARPSEIVVTGARTHNLQDITVRIPHGKLTVVTGPSGSGKTSLAFDTIFAEGQRRYVESLSTYARRFLGRMERAAVQRVEGIQPAIAIDQGASGANPRSTVATVTEVHDVLRVVWARVGTPHCPHCGIALASSSPSAVARRLAEAAPGAGWVTTVLPPEVDPASRRVFLLREGHRRLLVHGRTAPVEVDLEDADTACARLAEGATLVLDRVDPGSADRARVSEAVASGYRLGHGHVAFTRRDGGGTWRFTEGLVCPDHGPVLSELTPRHFSFNARIGMCPRCEGLGTIERLVPGAILTPGPFRTALSPALGAVLARARLLRGAVEAMLAEAGFTLDDPVADWPDTLREAVIDGEGVARRVQGRSGPTDVVWPGLVTLAAREGVAIDWTTVSVPCPACDGDRLRPEVRAVTVGGASLPAFSRHTVVAARAAVRAWSLAGEQAVIAARAREELDRRLGFLEDVGLGYLALDRAADTLSGGETRRIRLASQLGSRLVGVTYVLDEPTIGLHPRDTGRLLDTLEGLRDLGNTVIVVEHDPDTIARADHVLDLGPGSGRHGGHLVAEGTPAEVRDNPASVTGPWLRGEASMPASPWPRRTGTGTLRIEAPRTHNLRLDALSLPLGALVAVTGVSGSGKSSLVMDTIAPALRRRIGLDGLPGPHRRLDVDVDIAGVVLVDQQPIGRTPRSTPATYLGVMDRLRALFAQTPGAQARGWTPGRFSFNSPGGRCEQCEGRGAILVEMHFLPDVWVTCEACRGRRYSRETLDVRWKGHTIADVLGMRVDEAVDLFGRHRGLRRGLQAMVDVGLGYLELGQPSTTLSGGEAQRVKLAKELASRKGHAVYLLDEPTTGLHLQDVAKLLAVMQQLVGDGHSVIVVEHHLDVLAAADHLVELGPEGGEAGGLVVAQGTPEAVAAGDTPTGRALAAQAAFARGRTAAAAGEAVD